MRKVMVLLLLSCMIVLSACKSHEDGEVDDNYFDKSIYATDTVFQCLIDKDIEGIKELLCDRLKNVPDLDAQLQNLVNNINGNILPVDLEDVRGISGSGTRDNDMWTERSAIGTVRGFKTDTGKIYQKLLVGFCYTNDENPDLKGVYRITLEENDSIAYEVLIPEEKESEKEDYGTVYTPDGPRPATKEEQEAMLGEGATE